MASDNLLDPLLTNRLFPEYGAEPLPMSLPSFELWVKPKADEYNDGLPVWEIIGSDAQMVQFPLRPGRKVTCFSGAMAYMSDGIKMDVKLAGLGKTFGRLVGGGSLFQLTYTNQSDQPGYISMTPDYPGMIIPIDMRQTPKILALRDSFLCSTITEAGIETQISAGFNPSRSVAGFLCGGLDFIMQTIEQGEWSFLMSMGTIITKTLEPGESILVDGQAVLCLEPSVVVDVERIGGIAAICCAGEGIFNTTLTGPGKIWMQSMGIDKLRTLFPVPVSSSGGGGDGGDDGGGGDGGGE
mmetsp:Transcript_9899/g.15312  ORF Transcript_9899/g.15312 Transcript_9899/m.15312 type:complete len:297 (+) Transcript_9899:44-934(+)